MRRALSVSLVVSTIGLGAACGSDGDATPKSSKATDAAAACVLVRVDDASELFAQPARPKVPAAPPAAEVASECLYEPVNAANGQLLQVRIFDDASQFDRPSGSGVSEVTGLGSKAYVNAQPGLVDLEFVRGGKLYALAYSNLTNDAPAKAPQLEALAREVAGRL